mmetsp:Transcript_24392/g.38466  ORF Transcript_24392/g.38466 Transcript_24392/m.38466 type:complete len:98 (+) Transcript_24392:93-386(+)
MNRRYKTVQKKMTSPRHTTDDDEESFPSSFTKKDERVKFLFPWLRSYIFRRNLSFAAVLAAFVIVGATVSFVIMDMNGNLPYFLGMFKYQIFTFFAE